MMENTRAADDFLLHFGNEQLQIEIIGMRTLESLYTFEVVAEVVQRRGLPRFKLNEPQLIQSGRCELRRIHREISALG